MKPTYAEIANNWNLWAEYVDPGDVEGKEGYESRSVDERIKLQEEIWGPEEEIEKEDV